MMKRKGDFNDFQNYLNEKVSGTIKNIPQAVKLSCELVRSTILDDMANTPRNSNVTYYSGKNRNVEHHPSLPGNPPAPDTGNLRASIHYTVNDEENKVIGRIGTDVEYGKHLEFGTTNILPRPWLKPSMEKNSENIKKILEGVWK